MLSTLESRPLDVLFSQHQDLNESSINALVQNCNSISPEDDEKVVCVIQSLIQRCFLPSASQLAVKINNHVRKSQEIEKIHKVVANILRKQPDGVAQANLLASINNPRSPYWQNYGTFFDNLVRGGQFWAAKALLPLISNPGLQKVQQRNLSCLLAKEGRISEALSLNKDLVAKGIEVGELQEKWQFPSDHLPIGMTHDGDHFFSWNVLDAKYMSWITTKNTMGLSRSMIAQEHDISYNPKRPSLTPRDMHVASLVLDAIHHPTHPRSILALQECGRPFLEHLKSVLPPHFEFCSYGGNSILIDTNHFERIASSNSVIFNQFLDSPDVAFQNIYVRRLSDDKILRLINIHMPGNPSLPSRFEFAKYLQESFTPEDSIIVMGDMNFNEIEMSEALEWAFKGEIEMSEALEKEFKGDSPFSLYAPYCTNISPGILKSKAIDHFLVYPSNEDTVQVNGPNEVLPDLQTHVSLLGRKISV
ncbi:MAG: hypothetical protein K2Y01_10725 [Rhabdochlamydiaceae bacterium]|nr:hypothetical protein [Rhabdochlamydiaceae bacterium]